MLLLPPPGEQLWAALADPYDCCRTPVFCNLSLLKNSNKKQFFGAECADLKFESPVNPLRHPPNEPRKFENVIYSPTTRNFQSVLHMYFRILFI
jgi:hypothetical protein